MWARYGYLNSDNLIIKTIKLKIVKWKKHYKKIYCVSIAQTLKGIKNWQLKLRIINNIILYIYIL